MQLFQIPNPCLILKKIQRDLKNKKRNGLQRLRETHVVKETSKSIVIPEIIFEDDYFKDRKNYYNIFDDEDY
jgi:hypothetical protein